MQDDDRLRFEAHRIHQRRLDLEMAPIRDLPASRFALMADVNLRGTVMLRARACRSCARPGTLTSSRSRHR